MYKTKVEYVEDVFRLLQAAGYDISRHMINRAFTVPGKPGNKRGSRRLFHACEDDEYLSEVVARLTKAGVVFKGRKAVKFILPQPKKAGIDWSSQTYQYPPWQVCPECGNWDPQLQQKGQCIECKTYLEDSCLAV